MMPFSNVQILRTLIPFSFP